MTDGPTDGEVRAAHGALIDGTPKRTVPGPWAADLRAASVLHADQLEFRVLLMAAMMRCEDPGDRRLLAWAFPAVAGYLSGQGHDMPLGPDKPPAYVAALEETDLRDLAEQLGEAMGATPPAWAPAVIELIRRRHPQLWDDAVKSAKEIDQAKTEL